MVLMAIMATLLDVVAIAVAVVLTFDSAENDDGFDGGYDGGDAGGPSREAAGGGGGTEGVDHPAGAIPATMRAELRTVQTRQGALNVLLSHTACVFFVPPHVDAIAFVVPSEIGKITLENPSILRRSSFSLCCLA